MPNVSQRQLDHLKVVQSYSSFAEQTLGLSTQPDWKHIQLNYQNQDVWLSAMHSSQPNFLSDQFNTDLRNYRQLFAALIVWADLNSLWTTEQVLLANSQLAEVCIELALKRAESELNKSYGLPCDLNLQPIRMCILAMGKLGGGELNFSSDIDLIFCYSSKGQSNGKRTLDNEQWFIRCGQKLIHILDHVNSGGFVYRVDMRLRPNGQSGRLALSFAAMEQYYEQHGRPWERYAFIKARPVAGDISGGVSLLEKLKPFMYRRYLDFTALEEIRSLKYKLTELHLEQVLDNDIKLGWGGIREIEFQVQALQLLHGGRIPSLQSTSLLTALKVLKQAQLMSTELVSSLECAYIFLRDVENRLQYPSQQQTQTLPVDQESLETLAKAMNYPDAVYFLHDLNQQRNHVHQSFNDLFGVHQHAQSEPLQNYIDPQKFALFNFSDSDILLCKINQLLRNKQINNKAHNRIERLLPFVIKKSAQLNSDQALLNALNFIEQVSSRSTYLALLQENPKTLDHLLDLLAQSPWFAELLCREPSLLDELIDPRLKHLQKSQQEMRTDFANHIQWLNNDIEQWLYTLKSFQRSTLFKFAHAELEQITTALPASQAITWMAEEIIKSCIDYAQKDIENKYGQLIDINNKPAILIPVAYGSLGAYSLSYSSDLDLVFLYTDVKASAMSNGKKQLSAQHYFQRFVQRFLHYMSGPGLASPLFEVDMRLRPDGSAGMLVSSLAAFETYQKQRAWTWEAQALVRARAIKDTPEHHFQRIRHLILTQPDRHNLKDEVVKMRQKMHDELTPNHGFHIKHSPGGIIDVEFLCQYLVLMFSHQYPELTAQQTITDQLESFTVYQILDRDTTRALIKHYQHLQNMLHQQQLHKQTLVLDVIPKLEHIDVLLLTWSNYLSTKD